MTRPDESQRAWFDGPIAYFLHTCNQVWATIQCGGAHWQSMFRSKILDTPTQCTAPE